MSKGWIDSASISQVVQYFDGDYNKPDPYPWSYRTVVDLTVLLMMTDHQCIAPGVRATHSKVDDGQTRLYTLLRNEGIVRQLKLTDEESVKKALRKTKEWARREETIRKLQVVLDDLINDKENFQRWIDWVVTGDAWRNHAIVHGGLIDKTFSRYVQKVLGIESGQMRELKKMTSNISHLDLLSQKRDLDFIEACKGYMCSALIRGRFHLNASLLENHQLTPHPFREIVLPPRSESAVTEHITDTRDCLAKLVIYGAAQQSTLDKRLACWVENIRLIRPITTGMPDLLPQIDNPEVAYSEAYRRAKDANLIMGNKRMVTVIDFLIGLFSGAIIGITLDPITGIIIGATAGTASNLLKVSEKGSRVFWFRLRGRELKKAGAGLIRREWTNDTKSSPSVSVNTLDGVKS